MKPKLSSKIFLFLCFSSLVACSGGSDGVVVECPEGNAGENWLWTGEVCSLRRDGFNWGVSSIAPALDGSGDLYVVGSFTHFYNLAVKYIARLNNDGSLDRGFFSSTEFSAPSIVVPANDGSGDIYIGGLLGYDGSTHRGIARLNSDGSLDLSFDTGTGIGRNVGAIVPATDGSGDVYVGGLSIGSQGATFEYGPIRLNGDGTVDNDFNSSIRGGENSIALATDSSGDIYVSWSVAPYIARLNNDGSIDTEFDTGTSGFDRSVTNIGVATDGSGDIYVGGFFTEYNGISTAGLARLNSDGSFDTAFVADNSVFRYQGVGFVLPADDGSGDVYVDAANNLSEGVIRLNDDGSIDTGFYIGEGFSGYASLGDAAFTTDGSGDIYVAGDFTQYNSTPLVMLMRLNSEGVLIR